MGKTLASLRDSFATQPHGCGFALVCAAGAISVIALILGSVGNYEAIVGMPFWAIGAICIAGMTIGPLLALRWQYDAFDKKAIDLGGQLSGLQSQVEHLKSEHPQLLLEFKDNDNQFVDSGYFWVRARSESPTRTAHNVIVQIVAIEPLKDVAEEVRDLCRAFASYRLYSRLSSQGQGVFAAETMKDIHSGLFATFSVAGSQMWEVDKIVIGNHNLGHRGHVPNGPYRLRLAVSADDCRPAELTLVIGVNGSGSVIVELDKSNHTASSLGSIPSSGEK